MLTVKASLALELVLYIYMHNNSLNSMQGRRRSAAWYLLPIFIGLIGGVIGYFAVRKDDPILAKRLLYVGIGNLAIGIIFAVLVSLYAPDDFYSMPQI